MCKNLFYEVKPWLEKRGYDKNDFPKSLAETFEEVYGVRHFPNIDICTEGNMEGKKLLLVLSEYSHRRIVYDLYLYRGHKFLKEIVFCGEAFFRELFYEIPDKIYLSRLRES